jgi:hypothetical protein
LAAGATESAAPSVTRSVTPSVDEEKVVIDRIVLWLRTVDDMSGRIPLDADRLRELGTDEYAAVFAKSIEENRATGIVQTGYQRLTDPEVTITGGDEAKVRACIDPTGLRATSKDGAEVDMSLPKQAWNVSLVKALGTWKVSGMKLAGDC